MTFISPILDQALTYWTEIKHGNALALRADLFPENIAPLWPYTVILDVVDDGSDYHVKLFGRSLVETYGEQTGRKLSEITAPNLVRERSKAFFDFCRESAAPCYAFWPVTASEKRPFVDAEALCLPLSSDGSSLDKLMACNVNSVRDF
ncbi:PAS domain-containing protein [Pelagibius litoralis]|uniref:PAS domain-containing protein n=1 Tax=Pelagibius litoralis TaxID=374515 RepID=A0A967EYM2_9PROT|nr:PAS domain-containing protein [Pelagibius litoralis]NIA69833.1 PAS domain-containing protein [Pelagibius litoralis]